MFLASSYAVNVLLGRALGPAEFGLVSLAVAVQTFFNTIHGTGIPQAVSRSVAAEPAKAPDVLAAAQWMQIRATAGSAVLVLGGAAILVMAGDSVGPYLAAAALTLVPHGLLNLHLAYDGGLHRFRRQALLLSSYSVAKFAFVALLALPFRGIGALVGYGVASLSAFGAGRQQVTGGGRSTDRARLLRFAIPVVGFVGLSTLQMNLDLLLVHVIGRSSEQTGWYAAAQQVARVPYYAFAGLGMALLPGAARHEAENGLSGLAVTLAEALRYALILLAPVVTLLFASAPAVVELLYSERYLPGAAALPALMPGMAALTLFSILAAVLTGIGRPGIAVTIAAGALVVSAVSGLALIPPYGLAGAGAATTLGGLAAFCVGFLVLRRALGTLLAPMTALRVIGGAVAAGAILAAVRPTGAALVLIGVLLLAAYFAFLFVAGELRGDDWRRLRSVLPVRAD